VRDAGFDGMAIDLGAMDIDAARGHLVVAHMNDGAVLIVDLGANYRVTDQYELYLTAENLTDERSETGRSADGIVNIGAPRLVLGGVRCTW